MTPFAAKVGLVTDIDHVAAFKSKTRTRSQRGRELHEYFDQIIAMRDAKDEHLKSFILILKQALLNHVSLLSQIMLRPSLFGLD